MRTYILLLLYLFMFRDVFKTTQEHYSRHSFIIFVFNKPQFRIRAWVFQIL